MKQAFGPKGSTSTGLFRLMGPWKKCQMIGMLQNVVNSSIYLNFYGMYMYICCDWQQNKFLQVIKVYLTVRYLG